MKTASRILLTFAMLVFFTGMTFSQVASTAVPAKTATKSEIQAPGKFVDANKNGICDNHEAKVKGAPGKNFVDKNGDGKCDNCGGTGNCTGNGCGKGMGNGNCCGKGMGSGNGCGQGHQHRHGCATQGNTPATDPKK